MSNNKFIDGMDKISVRLSTVGHLLAAAATGAALTHGYYALKHKHKALEKKAGAWNYAKPILVGAGLGGVSGAVTAPEGHRAEWTRSGALIGGVSSGPAQVLVKRMLRKGTNFKDLAKAEIPHQNTADIFKWTGIGAAASSGITSAMGGYKHPDRSSRLGQAAEAGVDIGEVILRSVL